MPHRFVFMALSILMVIPSVSWAVNSNDEITKDYAGQFVTSLDAWDKNHKRPAQPEVAAVEVVTLTDTVKAESGGAQMRLVVNYPQGTGNEAVDQELKALAEKTMATYKKEAKNFVTQKPPQSGLMSRTFVISRSIDRYLSVIYYDYVEDAEESPYWNYGVVTYDLKEGHEIGGPETFPDSDDGYKIPGYFVNYVNAVLDQQCLAAGDDCQPCQLQARNTALRGATHMALTPEGVAVIFGPYELGEWEEQTKWLNIPKQKMVDWGVQDSFWIQR